MFMFYHVTLIKHNVDCELYVHHIYVLHFSEITITWFNEPLPKNLNILSTKPNNDIRSDVEYHKLGF